MKGSGEEARHGQHGSVCDRFHNNSTQNLCTAAPGKVGSSTLISTAKQQESFYFQREFGTERCCTRFWPRNESLAGPV